MEETKLKKQVLDRVKYTGFGDSMEVEIRAKIKEGLPEFTTSYVPQFGKPAQAELLFKQSTKNPEDYHFSRYQLSVDNGEAAPLKQTFYIEIPKQAIVKDANGVVQDDKQWVNSTVTLKEAYNMMDLDEKGQGRSPRKDFVTKEGEKYTAYAKLNFSKTDGEGNYKIDKIPDFDIDPVLARYHIKDLDVPSTKKEIVDSLYKGNKQTVQMKYGEIETTRDLSINAEFKTMNQYNGNKKLNVQDELQGKDQSVSEVLGQVESEVANKEAKIDKNESVVAEDGPGDKKKGQRNKKGLSA